MHKPDRKQLLLPTELIAVLLALLVFSHGAAILRTNQAQSKAGPIKDGIGAGEILIGESTSADVEARHGTKYELKNMNDYSYRMDYTDSQLAFYYCYQDPKKKIFLVEIRDGGVTSKGIVIGTSTKKDVVALYGEKSGGSADIFEYSGIQFYFEPRPKTEAKDEAAEMNRKVVEVDIVAPDKSSNFCG